ncbi:AAA family ATPase [Lentisphaerota bacterium WC36G]|nr:AAA family ATPase [Lentisphaerae bacterium WC36]
MITLNEEQQHAVAIALAGNNIFLTGKAGTGKTVVINEFRRSSNKNIITLAPTAFAATNLDEALTIHSALKLPATFFNSDWEPSYNKTMAELCDAVDVIIIDEISMVRADLFCAIDKLFCFYAKGNDCCRPFGGKQIIVVGDFYQLPPVVKNNEVFEVLNEEFNGIYAFNTLSWQHAKFTNIFLNKVHRQKDMRHLILLNAIRFNDPDLARHLEFSKLNVIDNSIALSNNKNICCVCCTKTVANKINLHAYNLLDSPAFHNIGEIIGKFPKSDLPVEQILSLKLQEKVVILANKRAGFRHSEYLYTNGDIGEIIDFDNDKKIVSIKLLSGTIVNISVTEWENYEYKVKVENGVKKIVTELVGKFIQYPMPQLMLLLFINHKEKPCHICI